MKSNRSKENMTDLGIRIRTYRKNMGMEQKELANLIGVDVSTVSQWENGRREPYPKYIKAIANVFDLDPDILAYGEGQYNIETTKYGYRINMAYVNSNPKNVKLHPSYNGLSDEKKKVVNDLIGLLADDCGKQ